LSRKYQLSLAGGYAVRWLWRRIQRQLTVLAAAVVVIINLVALSGVLHLSDQALGGLNAAVAAVLAFAVAFAGYEKIARIRRAHVVRARERPAELVLAVGGLIGEVVGRDVLCQVVIDGLLARRIRRAYVVVGGAGAGKTAFLVRLTKLLAERRAVPVPVRLRDAQEDLDFRELARMRFIADARAALVSDADVDTVWRQLSQDDKIVVLADGLEEALVGDAGERERDNLIRLAIRRANEQRLPLVIASRPDDSLRSVEAAIVELGPLSQEAALEYLQGPRAGEDERRLDWIVETAEVAETPLYLQIARQLYRSGLLEFVPRRADRPAITRATDRDQLRLLLLEEWVQALIDGHFLAGVPLSRADRQATIEHLSLIACMGLRLDRLEVRFDDVEALRTNAPSRIITEVEERLGKLKRRFDLRLAADWGASLGLIEVRGNGVRFMHSIMQAYLGSRLIDLAMADKQYRSEALRESGQDFLLALVMHSQVGLLQVSPEGAAPVPSTSGRTGATITRFLREEAMGRNDVKVLDLYATAFQIDAVQNEHAHSDIAEKVAEAWKDVWGRDQRLLEETKLRLLRRFGEAARRISGQQTDSVHPAKPAYLDFHRISCSELSRPVRLQGLREIGAGGDEAFSALQGILGPPADDQHDVPVATDTRQEGPRRNAAKQSSDYYSREQKQDQDDRVWLDVTSRAWLAPLLAGSVAEKRPDARRNLEQWLQYVNDGGKRRRTSKGTATIRLRDTRILVMREINAPKHIVYDLWTKPGIIMPCWGMDWVKLRSEEADLRVGGLWRYGSRANGESGAVVYGEYREIIPNERIVSTEIYAGMPEAEAVNTVTFTERDDRTILTVLVEHTSKKNCDAHFNTGFGRCMQIAMDLLELLAVYRRTDSDAQAWLHPSVEVALAHGFKYAANLRLRHPNAIQGTSAYLAEQALHMLRNSDFWYSRMTLVHALCLWRVTDEPIRRRGDPKAIVQHWMGYPGEQSEHPFVAEAMELAVLALEAGQPERFIWIDESSVAARIGSGPASSDVPRKRNLWIPPSAGWAPLHPRAQQLLADVLLLLNLTERGARPSDRTRRLQRTSRNDLPPCLSKDRSPLDPTRTVATAETSVPGSNCAVGCPFDLCPYPPKGELSYRLELSEAFARQQQALIGSGPILRKTAPWQANRPRELKKFWKQMRHRADEYRPGQI